MVILVLIFIDTAFSEVVTKSIDYAPFREAIANIIKQPTTPMTLKSTPLDCHFPNNSVMFTYASHYMTDLIQIQDRAMNASGLGNCLRNRFVRLCLDVKCREFCKKHGIHNCPMIDLQMLPPSDFNKGEYRFFTYLKHILLSEALKVADYAFFFDADVIVMKNPFPETQFDREESGQHKHKEVPFDMMFQRDRGRGNSCSGTVNSGQIYLRNSPQVQTYLQTMLALESKVLAGKDGLDQDFVAEAALKANMTTCPLTPHLYTAHCYQIFGNIAYMLNKTPVKDIISYHTSCVEGLGTKKTHLLRVLTAVEHKSSSGIGSVVRL